MPKTKRTALITGSGRNIGRACALALAADGINVVVNGSRDQDACEQSASMARDLGVEAEVAMGDIGKKADAHEIAIKAIQHFGAVDILVCNAAIRPSHGFLEMTDEQWHRVVDTNFMGSFWLARACLPAWLTRAGEGLSTSPE